MKPQSNPRVGQPIADVVTRAGKMVAEMNYWLMQALKQVGRNPVSTIDTPALAASPASIENTSDFDQDVLISGGTVSAVDFTRDGATFFPLPLSGLFRLNPGDALRVTYTAAPAVTVIPR